MRAGIKPLETEDKARSISKLSAMFSQAHVELLAILFASDVLNFEIGGFVSGAAQPRGSHSVSMVGWAAGPLE